MIVLLGMDKTSVLNTFRQVFFLPPLEQLLVTVTPKVKFGSFFTKLPPNPHQYKKTSLRRVVRQGIHYELDISDTVDWYIYFGFLIPEMQKLRDLIQPNWTVIDVGANVGNISLDAALRVGPTGKVISIEPVKHNYDRLMKNLSLNSFQNIIPLKVGLGRVPTEVRLGNPMDSNAGTYRVLTEKEAKNLPSETVQLTNLDTIVKDLQLTQINLIKMDIEGYELEALYGSLKTIQKFKPLLFVEVNAPFLEMQKTNPWELMAFIEKQAYRVIDSSTGAPVPRDYNFKRMIDILAYPL